MKKFYLEPAYFLLMLLLLVSAKAQTPNQTPPSDADDVVKITTKLVQFDAVVTDKDGNQVKNLTAADFEIFQDGKPQKITNFTYVNTATPNQESSPASKTDNKNIISSARSNLSSGGRVVTFIVDDGNCSASRSGMFNTRDAIEKFINEQMLPNDLVAIYQTRGGSSLLQQYTSDKTQLLRVARKIRWLPPTGDCAFSDGSDFEAATSNYTAKRTAAGMEVQKIESDTDRRTRQSAEDFSRNNQVIGTIGVLRYIINGLEKVGGRKMVFLLSDGIPFRSRDGKLLSAVDILRDLTDSANRASVVFDTIDVRGVYSTSILEARDEVDVQIKPNDSDKITGTRDAEDSRRQDGLYFLADATGGKFYKNNNSLDALVRRALNSETGYYLLGYEPEDESFKGKKFNKIDIKLKRPELKVSSRAGFIGKPDETVKPKKRTEDSELYEAVAAPLPHAGLNLQLTAFFGNSTTEGNFVRSLLHLDGNDITFVDDANGYKKAVFDVVAVTLNEKNEVVDEFNRTHTFRIEAAALPLIKKNGLIYTTDVAVKKPGTYNFRVAVRDASSRMLGSASQIIQVPNLKKDNIFLSGLTVAQTDAQGKFSKVSAVSPENALSLISSTAVPAVREFHRGMILAYAYTVYNAQPDKTTNQPKISVQMNLYRDGKLISEGKPQAAELEKQQDWTRVNDYGYLRLNQNIQPGDYTLQVIVTDLLSNQTSTQSVDFEVVD